MNTPEYIDGGSADLPPLSAAQVDRALRLAPVEIMVFVGQGCPHCPQAVRAALALARSNPAIGVEVVDAQRETDLVERFQVRSVPLTVIERQPAWVGARPVEELLRALELRGTPEGEAASILALLEAGRPKDVAHLIRTAPSPAPYVEAWSKSTTSSRIGLMMVAEEVLREGHTLDAAVPDLMPLLGAKDAALRGDTADLLGRIGHPSARPGLLALLEDPNPVVAEIAEEALGELRAG